MINFVGVSWTKSMRRLYFLVERCYKMREPVLLVGETGVGKTTVCQLLSILLGSKLHILNCHQYTETSDFLGVSCEFLFYFVIFLLTPTWGFSVYIRFWNVTLFLFHSRSK